MKLKGCLTMLGLLLVALLGISFFLPRDMNMSVTKDLEATPEQVFAQVNDVQNWKNWSPWFRMDTNMVIAYGEETVGQDASYTWDSKKKTVGAGAMIIDESIANEKVGTILKFEGEKDSYSDISISPSASGGSTVVWDFESDYAARMPWDRYIMLFYRKMLNGSYNKGLTAIDDYVKEHPEAHIEPETLIPEVGDVSIEELEVPEFNAVTVVRSGMIADMMENGHDIYANAFGEVMQMIESEGLSQAGMPLAFGNEWDEEAGTYELEIGIPVEAGGSSFNGGQAVKGSYYGPYEGIGKAHEALAAYMELKGLTAAGPPWEVYVTDPGEEPDPSKWLTEVFYLVSEN